MRVLFLSHEPHPAHGAFARSVGARVRIVPLKRLIDIIKGRPYLEFLYPLASLIASFWLPRNSEVILVDGGSSLYAAVFLSLRGRRRQRIILLDGDLLFYRLARRRGIAQGLIREFLRRVDGVISVSDADRRLAQRFVRRPQRVCNPFPAAVSCTRTKRERWGVYVGRLDPDKKVMRTIRYGVRCPHIGRMLVVGDGPMRAAVERLARREPKLRYLGRKDDVGEVLSRCTLLFHFPDHDPFPCVVMEAASCGCFPVLSRGVGNSSLFDERFVVDDPEDFAAIDRKVGTLLSDRRRSRALLRAAALRFPTRGSAVRTFREAFGSILAELEEGRR
ncbi:glycosyltransferase family 4 protein [Candidatus Woesearchaeota archaeon]|nr:glycosyltransferase family 4 protein [Candidatus Woesearchaeota archaeon]